MADLVADQRDIEFILFKQFRVEQFTKYEKYSDFNRKMFDMVLKEARNFAIKEILPTYKECDTEGVRFENGKVKVPSCLKRVHRLLMEGEWGALTEDPEYGGQGLMHTIAQGAMEYMIGANYIAMTYPILGHGAGKMIELFGTEKQKELFLEKLYTLEWGGTMLLTEPGAGSDIGAVETSARPLEDGTYEITGSKIFITNGDQDLTENIIHPVLARIEGAPAGTKGISLFIVPKIWVNEDGGLGEFNDVVCTGIEEKLGLHGSPTCSLSLGDKGGCRGLLLGHENRGMEIMFHMMNEVRLEVGTQGFTHAGCAYLHALDYAGTRKQGRALENLKNPEAPQVPIIQHPDVRRMLLKMKSYVEGMRSLTYFTAFCFDMIECTESSAEKEHYADLVEILTPVVKAYLSDRGFDVCSDAMQVFGGYGYTGEYPVEQLVRDSRIASIYEGTNGIQAMDFLARKVAGKKGALLEALVKEIRETVAYSEENNLFADMADTLDNTLDKLEKRLKSAAGMISSESFRSAFAIAYPMLDATGDVIMAWMLLWRAQTARNAMDSKNRAFYEGKIHAARFFFDTIVPVTMGKLDAVPAGENPAVSIDENSF
ncbi:MAG: acyl-CoA dehydrogenase [Desulfobacteraceae bacterium]